MSCLLIIRDICDVDDRHSCSRDWIKIEFIMLENASVLFKILPTLLFLPIKSKKLRKHVMVNKYDSLLLYSSPCLAGCFFIIVVFFLSFSTLRDPVIHSTCFTLLDKQKHIYILLTKLHSFIHISETIRIH
jgi:hypothetical protein